MIIAATMGRPGATGGGGEPPSPWFDYDFTSSAHLAALEQINFSNCTPSTGTELTVLNSKSATNDVAKLLVAAPSEAWQLSALCGVDVGNWPKTLVGVFRSSNGYWIDLGAGRQSTSSTAVFEGSAFTPNYSDNTIFVSGVQPGWVRVTFDLTNYRFYTSTDGSSWTLRATIAPATYLGAAGDKIGLGFNSGNPSGTRTHKVYRMILEALP